jgi:hypothetical protein
MEVFQMMIRLWTKWLVKTFQIVACVAITGGCAEALPDGQKEVGMLAEHSPIVDGEAKILQSWQGDYPVAHLDLLPEDQREQPVGYIGDAETFEAVWSAFKPRETVRKIDFRVELVLFVRNTQFYNTVRIGKVKVKNGVAEVLAMETMSAMPIEDKVAMSLVVVPKQGITGIQAPDAVISVNDNR